MHLFDAHCHLQDERLAPFLDACMERATRAGVVGFMCCGSSEADWPLLPGLTQRFPGVLLSFGLHPWYVGDRTSGWLDSLRRMLSEIPSAVGEIGLDRALDPATFAEQEAVFLAQLHLANEFQRPVSIHCRRAWGRLMELLDDKGWPACGFVLHSYSGSTELIAPLVRRGAFFSFSGAITFDHNRRGREAVAAVPLDRLLIETDAPDLMPTLPSDTPVSRDAAGKPLSEPAYLVRVLETVADLRSSGCESIATATRENARLLFAP